MSDKPKKKTDEASPLREPKPKTNKFGLGIKPNTLKFPHDDLIKPLAEESNETPPSHTTPLHLLPPPTKQSINTDIPTGNYPISPSKDFQKVPNSVVRDALPLGLFKGTSKHTYDALFLRTRGAIVPTRTIKVRFNDLMNWTNISHNTLRNHLRHLEQVGLIKRDWQLGDNDGAVYEVLVPDELGGLLPPPTTSYHLPPQPSPTSRQNMGSPSYQKMVAGGGGQNNENKDTFLEAKTLIKTEEKRIDDEPAAAFRSFNEKINEVFRQLMGREAKQSDSEALAAIGELLAAEILEAASRTKVVSDAAKFSLTHLRRRLGVRTIKVETLPEKETEKGTTSAKPTKREIQLTDDEIQECPDCQGRLLIYPEGPGRGAVMCKHSQLVKAKQAETQKAEGSK